MERPERDELIPPVVIAVLKPALKVGALSGMHTNFLILSDCRKRVLQTDD